MKKILLIIMAVVIMTTDVFALSGRDSLILVNETYTLDETEMPENTVNVADYVKSNKKTVLMQPEAAENFIKMAEDMKAAGLNIMAVSGYRTYAYQQKLFDNQVKQYSELGQEEAYNKAKSIVAVPGTSEHQTGFTLDVSTDGTLEENFADTDEGKWIAENAHNYGFIIRYPKNKQEITKIIYEPWHIRYVGLPHAEIMYVNGFCLEEYIEILKNNDSIEYKKGDEQCIIKYQTVYEEGADIISVSDTNTGGYIVVKRRSSDPLEYVKGNWAQDAIIQAYNEGLLTAHGAIMPTQPIDRESFVRLFSRYISSEKIRNYSGFADVKQGGENYEYIVKAYESGIINGYGENFEPGGYITRQQAAVIISKLLNLEEIQLIEFSDLGDIAGWAFQDVQKVCAYGIMNGYEDGSFRPGGNISIAEAAALLQKIANKQ